MEGQGYDPSLYAAAALGVIFVLMLLRIARRGGRKRRVRMERMWIGPAIFLALSAFILRSFPPPPSPLVYGVLAIAALFGAGVGWLRGRMTQITLNLETHELMSQMSVVGLLVIMGILAARLGLRSVLNQHRAEWHISAAALTDGFLLFYLGMVTGRQAEIFLRCRRLLREAKAAEESGRPPPETVTEDHA